jgi:hypothetical protein
VANAWRALTSAGSAFGFMPARMWSHTRFMIAPMSRVPEVMATTASCSGITMQYWPNAPSPR